MWICIMIVVCICLHDSLIQKKKKRKGVILEIVGDLARRNARVILACHSVERGETAAIEARKTSGNDNVTLILLSWIWPPCSQDP